MGVTEGVTTYSLLVGLFATLLVVVLVKISTVFRVVKSLITWCSRIKQLRSLPSPPRQWFWGHAAYLGFTQGHLLKMMDDMRKYPKWCVYWIGPFIPYVITSDVEIIKKLMHQPGESPKPHIYGFLDKWLGQGLVTGHGEKWKRHRKMLTQAFHFDILKQYIPVYNDVCNKLLEIWSPFADNGESINIDEYLNLYTLDVFLRCIYSSNSNCLEDKEKATYVVAVKELLHLFSVRTFTPHYAYDCIYYSTAAGRKFLHYCDVVHKFSDDVIMQRREELLQKTKSTRKYKDFLDILLSIKDENGEGLTDSEIREEVDTFVFAGHDTTSLALSWCLYCLAKYKEHQELCRKEIRAILAGRDSSDIIWEDLSKLSYTTMCIKETLRLYPLTVMVSKISVEDVVADGYTLPKGSWVGIGIYFIQHDPSIWNNPEKFDPLRFSIENIKEMDPFTYLAFSAGSRNCIGQRFALQEMKVTLAHILNRFELDLDATHQVEPHFNDGLYKSKTGIKLKMSNAA